MKYQLRIQLRSNEGAVLRALGLVQRRGYQLDSCNLAEASGNGRRLDIRVSSERSGALLKRQLERLHDVLWAELEQPAMPAGKAANVRSLSGSM